MADSETDVVTELVAEPVSPAPKPSVAATPLSNLVALVSGCRSDTDGFSAKQKLVKSFVEEAAGKPEGDYLYVLCTLHEKKCITIMPDKVLKVLGWQKASATLPPAEAEHVGYFLASVLASNEVNAMPNLFRAYVASNPKADQVQIIKYINSKGFLTYKEAELANAIEWMPPADKDSESSGWRTLWGREAVPSGAAWYATLRDRRGAKVKVAFLGSVTEDGASPMLQPPSALTLKQWKLPKPNMCITVDAGSMHPRSCDETHRMANLPQFSEWVNERNTTVRISRRVPTTDDC